MTTILRNAFIRKKGWLLLWLALAGCTQSQPTPKYRIGFSQCSMEGPWRKAMLAGMLRELSFYPDAELVMLDAHDNSNLQKRQIQELVSQKVDLLIVSPYEAAPVTPAVEQAYASGIPVVLLDRRINSEHYTAFVGGDNREVGRTAGRYAARLLDSRGHIIEVLGTPGSSATTGRHQGFRETLRDYPGLQVVAKVTGDWRDQALKPALRAALLAHPEVRLIFAHNDGMGRGAFEVCRELGRADQVHIIGVDGLPGDVEGIDLVRRGQLSASLLYSPGGEDVIRTALRILHQQPYRRENELGTMIIDSTNALTMQQQASKVSSQQQEIEQQQSLLKRLRATYASQRVALYSALLSLLGAIVLGAMAWRSARRNRVINQQLAVQNARNDEINHQLSVQNQEILQQRNQLEVMAERARTDTEAKLRFFTNFSHELRTPLTLILGPLEELMGSGTDFTNAQRHELSLVRRNTQRLLQLVNQLLDFRKIEVGKMAVQATEGNLVSFVREIVEVFAQPARGRGVQLRFMPDAPVLMAWFDGNILDKVFFNLLSNALKFTPDHGLITVRLRSTDDGRSMLVSVTDTGRGISDQDRSHIFEWFYQGDQGAVAKGSGMGLALAQGLVRLHQGQLTFSSQPGRGSTFTVSLPRELPEALLSCAPAAPVAFALDEPEPIGADLELAPEQPAGSDTLVLVIEDNPEVNDFVARKLRPSYRVQTATDGAVGLELATNLIPDLIVCDVMMPGLSGLELVAQLRADWRTSHVPVVLLTARGAPEQQVEGMQAGADLYLTKPFNPSFLLESVRTLLLNRSRQKAHYRRELALENATPTTPADQQFLSDLTAIVEANLTKTDLSVDEIARSLGVSRMQLYRKVKAVLGTGVSEFIQDLRLTKARELLLDESLTIAQIAYELGFSSPSYFSTSFRTRYQLTPSDFRARRTSPTS